MPRFTVSRREKRVEIVFDDGAMNLLSAEALRELGEALERAGGGAGAPLVFRSARAGLFAAGADMAEMRAFAAAEASKFAALGQELFDRIERLPMLTIAVIDGDCFGGALDLAMSFDARIATPRSRFAHPGARLGIATGFGGTTRWRKLVGRPAANKLFIANTTLGAPEAFEAGVIDEVTDDPETALIRLQNADPRAIKLVKELTNHAAAVSRSQLLLLARRLGNLYFSGS